ncbi:MAG: hypothetical protein K2X86_04025 [Cytophagaceae bacterium]|nr:hypothetical protein [Cytophagaceae bacterium]
MFLGGWTKYAIENPNSKDDVQGSLAGLKSVIKYYKAGNGTKKDKKLDKWVEKEKNGELEQTVKDILKK